MKKKQFNNIRERGFDDGPEHDYVVVSAHCHNRYSHHDETVYMECVKHTFDQKYTVREIFGENGVLSYTIKVEPQEIPYAAGWSALTREVSEDVAKLEFLKSQSQATFDKLLDRAIKYLTYLKTV